MTVTLNQLSTACKVPTTITRTVVIPPDKDTPFGCMNVWVGAADKRYPDDTVYPPVDIPGGYQWTWGPNFEFSAPAELSAIDLAERIAATIKE